MILHRRLVPFADKVAALMLCYGNTTGLLLCWLTIRDWSLIPTTLYVYFPVLAFTAVAWTFAVLTAMGRINSQSKVVLAGLNRQRKTKGLEKELRAMQAIHFRAGSCHKIGMGAPGDFIVSLSDNLTTAVLTY